MRIMILGRTEVLFESARRLAQQHDIVLIVTAPAAREYKRNEEDFQRLAAELHCECLVARRLGDQEIAAVTRARPDIVVSMNWVSVVDGRLIDAVPGGVLNAHFGELPRYRGNAVINWAILKREPRIAFTIHYMLPDELDAGPIAAQEFIALTQSSTIGELLAAAESRVPALFVDAVALASGQRPAMESSAEPGFRCYPRLPVDSKIDWSASASDIDALVRASGPPFGGAFTYQNIDGRLRRLTIWASRVVAQATDDVGSPGHIIRNDSVTGESWVYTGAGILALMQVQYDDEDAFAPGRVWKSIRVRLGVDLEELVLRLQRRLDAGV